ncbi:hypothetical protein [Nocardia tenerifensis]|uniref:hypothetical protein n=1 Tax=Nocardia tenerifensis TaxID=228006 RepID=UPI0002D7331D|nr:hypothetical protein [Nocardia tenerifensis]
MRAATPPANWLDLVDRLGLLICSDHWTRRAGWSVTGVLAALTIPLIALAAIGGLMFGAVAGGGVGVVGAGLAGSAALGWLRRRRGQVLAPAPQPPGEHEDPGSEAPRAA